MFLKRNEKKNKATAPFSECYSLHAIGLVSATHPNTYAYWSKEAGMCNTSIVLNTIEIQSKLFQLKFVGNTTKHCAMVHLKLKKNRITNWTNQRDYELKIRAQLKFEVHMKVRVCWSPNSVFFFLLKFLFMNVSVQSSIVSQLEANCCSWLVYSHVLQCTESTTYMLICVRLRQNENPRLEILNGFSLSVNTISMH